jgi:hypothetical protein
MEDQTSNSEQQKFKYNVALLIALVPVIAAAIRIWTYSGGDTTVFLVLLKTLNIPTVLIGTSVLIIPSLILLAAIVLLSDWKARDWTEAWLKRHQRMWIAAPILFLVVAYTAPWSFFATLAGIALLVAFYFLIKRYWPWGKKYILDLLVAERGSSNGPDSIITIPSVIIVFLIAPANMWLPLERIQTTKSVEKTVYVLESTQEWTTLLSKDRKLEILRTDEVKSREICHSNKVVSIATSLYQSGTNDGSNCET